MVIPSVNLLDSNNVKHTVKKIIFVSATEVQIKQEHNGETKVVLWDFNNRIGDIVYRALPTNSPEIQCIGLNYNTNYKGQKEIVYDFIFAIGDYLTTGIPNISDTYPFYSFIAQGETETPETPTQTILFPPPETHEQFMERIWAKLLRLTRRIKILRHEEPHQNALSKNICREVPADHDEVLRYDIACNLIKRPVGWLALQLTTQQTRYNAHLASVESAKAANRTPPTFGYSGEYAKLEAMLDKLEANLTEDCLQEHFDMHDHAEWDKIQNKQRKITLCDDDYSPGEVLVDVNSFFTDGNGRVAEEHAKRTYHEISTKYWVMAKRTPHRNLVTERKVEL